MTETRNRVRPLAFVVAAVAGVGAVGVAVSFAVGRAPTLEGLAIVNGRIEGDPVVVAAKVSGRIVALHVKEGDRVETGQLIAELSAEQMLARVDQAAAGEDAASSTLEAAQAAAKGAHNQRGRAEAARAASVVRREKVATDARRAEVLFRQGLVSRAELDDARATHEIAATDVRAAEEGVAAAERAIESADAQVVAAQRQVRVARAVLEESRATLADTKVHSPSQGVVSTKVAEQGEVLAAGTPIVVVTDLDRLHMKAYVPEPEIGRIKLSDAARIRVDAFPNRPFAATVREIASASEFTPKEVQTHEERVKQVIAVKLALDANPGHALVPGMPADAAIRWNADAPWVDAVP